MSGASVEGSSAYLVATADLAREHGVTGNLGLYQNWRGPG